MSRALVVGAGTMGNGIAHVFAQAGWETTLVDVAQDALTRALKTIEKNIERLGFSGARANFSMKPISFAATAHRWPFSSAPSPSPTASAANGMASQSPMGARCCTTLSAPLMS